MKIAIDTFVLNRTFRNQGSYVYARKILQQFKALVEAGSPTFQLLVSSSGDSDAHEFGSREGFELIESGLISWTKSWRVGISSFVLGRSKADVAFFPAPVNCMFSRLPSVVTVYDATILKAPSQTLAKSSFERMIIWNAMMSASAILTLSHNSKADLSNHYKVPAERIAVVYLAYDSKIFRPVCDDVVANDLSFIRSGGLSKPYVMHHGVIQPRKNLERLIEAYWLALERNPDLDFDLVLVGPLGWRSEGVLRAAHQAGKRGTVRLTGPVSDLHLAVLIRQASLCVIPSLYEGFCLPLLECMACGSPTIASRTSCLPEISGGALQYFDPYSIEEIAETMTAALRDSHIQKMLAKAGLQRASEFTWERSARETLQVLMQTCKETSSN